MSGRVHAYRHLFQFVRLLELRVLILKLIICSLNPLSFLIEPLHRLLKLSRYSVSAGTIRLC